MSAQIVRHAFLLITAATIALGSGVSVQAANLEAYEFNDATGTTLANAANSANPTNLWLEDSGTTPSGMAPSDIRGGVYNIVKASSVLESNYFQIANITSGTRYLEARMSGWNFQIFDSANLEEFRVAFLNDDDANFGSTITSQFTIRRESSGGRTPAFIWSAMRLEPAPRIFPVTLRSQPIKRSRSRPSSSSIRRRTRTKCFTRMGRIPRRCWASGPCRPTVAAIRSAWRSTTTLATSAFDYPVEFLEVFSVDRIAVTDTNPLTDLITLEIDRTNGAMTLKNTSGAAVNNIESYSITSATGSMNPDGWDLIGSSATTSTNEQLAESLAPAINLANNQTIGMSLPAGAWLKSPFEDVHMVLNLTGGATRTVNVDFVGNTGVKWISGDLNFDNSLTGADWLLFIAESQKNLSGLSIAEAYQKGDLNSDGLNNIADFTLFKTAYDAVNGAGAFVQMLATVPEPGSVILLGSAWPWSSLLYDGDRAAFI